jgi:hypothetical protein
MEMAKIYTVTINDKEQFVGNSITGVRICSNRTGLDFYAQINADSIANALPGLFKSSPEWATLDESALTFDLNEFVKLFGLKGRIANDSGWGSVRATHKSTATRISILDN